jgi:uncharacterized protein YsxB (DUF464 family)
MIQVTIHRDPTSSQITGFDMVGHADFAQHGQDIVCAGASAVSFGSLNAVEVLTGITLPIQSKGEGDLHVQVPIIPDRQKAEQVQFLLEGMLVSLETIRASYGKYLKMNEIVK